VFSGVQTPWREDFAAVHIPLRDATYWLDARCNPTNIAAAPFSSQR
jgi:hypothetical protein